MKEERDPQIAQIGADFDAGKQAAICWICAEIGSLCWEKYYERENDGDYDYENEKEHEHDYTHDQDRYNDNDC